MTIIDVGKLQMRKQIVPISRQSKTLVGVHMILPSLYASVEGEWSCGAFSRVCKFVQCRASVERGREREKGKNRMRGRERERGREEDF